MNAEKRIQAAFHELTISLLSLFDIYNASPDLIEHAADEIESILRHHLKAPRSKKKSKGKLALERLLDELEAHNLTFDRSTTH